MDEKLLQRLESAVSRLESLSPGSPPQSVASASSEPSIVAFDDLIAEYVGKVSAAAEKIGGQVKDITNVLRQAFLVQKELLVNIKRTQKPDAGGMIECLRPLNEKLTEASNMTRGPQSDFSNHLKSTAESLTALAWIAYTGKDCGMSMPIAHVEECWQSAEFYSNKVLIQYKNKDSYHVEWAKALKELFVPGLRDYVKSHHPLGPVWSATGVTVSAPSKSSKLAAPNLPPSSLASSSSSSSSSSKQGMAAVFQEISTKPVTAGCCCCFEIVNCGSIEVQCQGAAAPTISIDNTAGCQLYLSKDSLESSITTSKASEVNVMVPSQDPGDLAEHALPYQYIHTYKDGQFVTTPISHSGGDCAPKPCSDTESKTKCLKINNAHKTDSDIGNKTKCLTANNAQKIDSDVDIKTKCLTVNFAQKNHFDTENKTDCLKVNNAPKTDSGMGSKTKCLTSDIRLYYMAALLCIIFAIVVAFMLSS